MKLQLVRIMMGLLLAIIPELMYAFGFSGIDSLTPGKDVQAKIYGNSLYSDSLLPDNQYGITANDPIHEILNIETCYSNNANNRSTLFRLLKVMRVKKILHYPQSRHRLFSDLAEISARLRLYPFAMRCYYQSINPEDNVANETWFGQNPDFQPDWDVCIDTSITGTQDNWKRESNPVKVEQILQSFDDGKPILACALILHIKQPSPGKRKAFAGLNNVGHMFITLIKYNADKSIVSRSFGFYPDKDDILSATPLHPLSCSVIKDDAYHNWDEAVGKFISHRRLLKILRLLNKYENKKYQLNNNNCTDFGLYVAMISGIDVQNTKGKWLFGKGNNPACAGQSVLEGKLKNTDTGSNEGLFLCNSYQSQFNSLKK
ncbi:MAG TPA: hypothetical protein VKI61_07090 [Chitinophagaceae bacterium]|nr:hypothetical protein [Chitinophagaceae bacterium]